MTKLLAVMAAALVLLSGCTPTSLAQGKEDDAAPQVAIARSTSPKLESKLSMGQPAAEQAKVQKEPANLEMAQQAQESANDPNASRDAERQPVEPPDLWMDVSMGAELIDWFNETAYPVDVARVDHVSRIDLLENVEVGRRLVVFKNVADAEQLLPRLADRMDIIGYNLEHGPANRPDERADPVGSVQRMRALADEYGLALALGPDRAFALNDGLAMAPYVDMFVLQVQRAQTEPDVVRDFVLPLVAELRVVNPDLEISVQVRTEGDPVEIAELINSMKGSLDGVSILTNDESTDIAQALVAELRPPKPIVPTEAAPPPPAHPSPTQSSVQAATLPTPTSEPRRTSTAPPVPMSTVVPATASAETESSGGWLLMGSIAALSVLVVSLFTTAAVYGVQKFRQ
jgi:hypothetical protein